MKTKKVILSILSVLVLIILIVLRLAANKKSFDQEIQMVSESTITIPVITEKVAQKEITREYSVNGSFVASQEIAITSEIQGKIASVTVETGDQVSSGQVLATLNKDVVSAQLETAVFNLSKAEKDLQRNEQLLKTGGVTTQQYEQSRQTAMDAKASLASIKNQMENSTIKAPFDGIITKRYSEKGAFIATGTTLFDLVKINKIRLRIMLTASEIQGVKKGDHVKISIENHPEILAVGTVYTLNVKADASKRYEVEVEMDNKINQPIKPGMYGTAIFSDLTKKSTLTIPRKAIAGSIKDPEVYIVKGDSVLLRKISINPYNEKEFAVLEGLNQGDLVVVSGQINLVNGSKIKLIQ